MDTDTSFLRAARPVLDAAVHAFADTEMSLGLTDAHGRIIWRWADNSRLLTLLDRHFVDIGFRFDEEEVGTNGAGTVLETGTPVMIGGGEHFADALKLFACFAAPVHNPVTGRLAGVLSVSCKAEEATPLMRAMILRLASDVEAAILQHSTAAERELMDRYLCASRRLHTPVVAVNEDFMICDRQASLLGIEHGLLWDQVRTVGPAPTGEFPLPGGQGAVGRYELLSDGPRTTGAIVSIREPAKGPSPTGTVPEVGAAKWDELAVHAANLLTRHGRVLLHGETGVGKTAMLSKILGTGPRDVFDAALQPIDPSPWLHQLVERLNDRRGAVILQHVDALPADTAGAVGSLIRAALSTSGDIRVSATVTGAVQPQVPTPMLDLFDNVRLEVPPLRRRTDDIRRIVADTTVDSARHVSPEASEAILRFSWPGNDRQLDRLLFELLGSASGQEVVGLASLPHEIRAATGPVRVLSPLEEAEASVILGVLAECQGNKKEAALRLGISRRSLYTKLQTYRISDVDLLVER